MTNVDDVLEQCLTDILTGASTLEECLARYPEHATQLEPLLQTAARVGMGARVRPSPAFRARARAKLTMHMQAYPHKRVGSRFPFGRLVTALVTILLTLFVTGTVYAQGVLPGDPFYPWKLTSERAWRLISSDTVKTDLEIANRRIDEMTVTAKDHARWKRALEGYSEVRTRLEKEVDEQTLNTILPPADTFIYPDSATQTPEPVAEPKETKAPKDKDKDKDKDNGNQNNNGDSSNNGNNGNNSNNNGKDKNNAQNKGQEDDIPAPVTDEPKIDPTIEVPPPIR